MNFIEVRVDMNQYLHCRKQRKELLHCFELLVLMHQGLITIHATLTLQKRQLFHRLYFILS
jgi:hypothetical protein